LKLFPEPEVGKHVAGDGMGYQLFIVEKSTLEQMALVRTGISHPDREYICIRIRSKATFFDSGLEFRFNVTARLELVPANFPWLEAPREANTRTRSGNYLLRPNN
jgi:hypothetical protein